MPCYAEDARIESWGTVANSVDPNDSGALELGVSYPVAFAPNLVPGSFLNAIGTLTFALAPAAPNGSVIYAGALTTSSFVISTVLTLTVSGGPLRMLTSGNNALFRYAYADFNDFGIVRPSGTVTFYQSLFRGNYT